MKRYLLSVGVILIFSFHSYSQQSRVYSQFFMNPFQYNPAYAGVEGHTVLFAMYRQQWINVDGAPSISHLSFHTPLKGGIGIGATAFNEAEGLLNTVGGKVSASYLWSIDRKHYLRMGMSIGGGNKTINTDGFDSPSDPAFASLAESSTFTIAEFGATYHFDHFNVGFALPNLVSYDIVTPESFSPVRVNPLDEMLLKVNYRGHINDNFAFEPHVLYRYNTNLPNQYEVALISHLKHLIWIGGSYRQDAGFIGLFGAKIKEFMAVGFAYDMGNTNYSDILGSTFEVHLGIHIGTKKHHAEHVSSFIKSHQKTLEEREREKQRQAELAARREQMQKEREERLAAQKAEREKAQREAAAREAARQDSIRIANETLANNNNQTDNGTDTNQTDNNQVDNNQTDNGNQIANNQTDNGNQTENNQTDNGNQVVNNNNQTGTNTSNENVDNTNGTNNTDIGNQSQTDNNNTNGSNTTVRDTRSIDELASSNDPKRVKRGGHLLELQHGNYIVAGVFEDFDRAEGLSDNLFERGYRDVIVGYVSHDRKYHVVIFRSQDLEQTRSERNRLRGRPGLEKIWLLTVE